MRLRTSDVAACAETSLSTVRGYSDHGLLGPIPRAENSNYRCFDPRVIPQVYLWKSLRELGLSAQQLRAFGQNRTPEHAKELFQRYSQRLGAEISRLQARRDMLQSYVSFIEEGLAAVPGEIGLRALPERPVDYSPLERFGRGASHMERLRRAFGRIRKNGNASCPVGFAYNDFYDLLEQPDRPALLVSYNPQGTDALAGGEYLLGTAAGSGYGESGDLPRRMFDYALRNDLEFFGPAYAVCLLDAASVAGEDQFLLQVAAQVKKTNDAKGA